MDSHNLLAAYTCLLQRQTALPSNSQGLVTEIHGLQWFTCDSQSAAAAQAGLVSPGA